MSQFVVCHNRSVCLPSGTRLTQGQKLPEDIEPKLLKEWQSTNFIRPVGSTEGGEAETTGVVTTEGTIKEAPQRVVQNGKFNHDPAALEGKDLEDLNVMLVELDADPVETVEEAIGLLSSDRPS